MGEAPLLMGVKGGHYKYSDDFQELQPFCLIEWKGFYYALQSIHRQCLLEAHSCLEPIRLPTQGFIGCAPTIGLTKR